MALDVKTALAQLGWRVDTERRLAQAILDFQRMWNLGTGLVVDGDPGPATRAALQTSLNRRAARLPNISDNFNAREFACACNGENPQCRRIWAHRALVRACETYRADYVGPVVIVRGCRCELQNDRVGGAENSQHLYGTGVDVQVFDVSPSKVIAGRFVSGVGRYETPTGKWVVRHLDVRHVWGTDPRNTTDSTIASPAQWKYGVYSQPLLTPRPAGRAPSPPPSEEDDMANVTDAEKDMLLQGAKDAAWLRSRIDATDPDLWYVTDAEGTARYVARGTKDAKVARLANEVTINSAIRQIAARMARLVDPAALAAAVVAALPQDKPVDTEELGQAIARAIIVLSADENAGGQ